MTTKDKYTEVPDPYSWQVPSVGDARFTWEYDDGRARLLALYQKGKDKQWDAESRIDWSLDVDPMNPIGMPDQFHPLFGSPAWESADERRRAEMRQHNQAWNFSQFLHGEQGAMVCAAKIVEVVPDMDAKFYAATQTMDEARHVEAFSRFLQEKVGLVYPINTNLSALLADTSTTRAGICLIWGCRSSSRDWLWPPSGCSVIWPRRVHCRNNCSPMSCRTRPGMSPSAGSR